MNDKRKEMIEVTKFFINVLKACNQYGTSEYNNGLEDIAIENALFNWTDVRDHPEWYGVRKINLEEEGINELEAMEEVVATMAYKYLGIANIFNHPLWTERTEYIPTLHEYLVQNYNYHLEVLKALEEEVNEFYNIYKNDIIMKDGYAYSVSDGMFLSDAIWNYAPLFCNETIASLVTKLHKRELKL